MNTTATAKKATFQFGRDEYQVYTNGKEYGANRTVYIEATKVGSSSRGKKGSYSIARESFVDYQAGDLDLIKAAAKSLGIIE